MSRLMTSTCCVFLLALLSPKASPVAMQSAVGTNDAIAVRVADVGGLKVQYFTAGQGPAILLLHGYAETSRMWRPLIPILAANFTVIAPDLPGIGGSDIPKDGLDMARAGARMHDLVRTLGVQKAVVVGHDIGLMVTYAYAASYARPGRMRSAWAYFVSFQQAAKDFERFSQTKLTMPVLSIGGDKANGDALGQQAKLVASNATSVTLSRTGHWLMEENFKGTVDALMRFLVPALTSTASSPGVSPEPVRTSAISPLAEMRLTPAEIRANQTGSEQVGSSGLAGVSTKVLFGDPSKAGFYTIVLSVPARTTIAAHMHGDDRMATVVSGTWHFGYGKRFDETALKSLAPGSVYSEPGGVNHFARTEADAVLVQISGFGPTDTHYFDSADTPTTLISR